MCVAGCRPPKLIYERKFAHFVCNVVLYSNDYIITFSMNYKSHAADSLKCTKYHEDVRHQRDF